MIQMTKALVGELATVHIRINCIIPGIFHTPLTDYKLSTEEQRKESEELIPLHFVAEPTDLDGAIFTLPQTKHLGMSQVHVLLLMVVFRGEANNSTYVN